METEINYIISKMELEQMMIEIYKELDNQYRAMYSSDKQLIEIVTAKVKEKFEQCVERV